MISGFVIAHDILLGYQRYQGRKSTPNHKHARQFLLDFVVAIFPPVLDYFSIQFYTHYVSTGRISNDYIKRMFRNFPRQNTLLDRGVMKVELLISKLSINHNLFRLRFHRHLRTITTIPILFLAHPCNPIALLFFMLKDFKRADIIFSIFSVLTIYQTTLSCWRNVSLFAFTSMTPDTLSKEVSIVQKKDYMRFRMFYDACSAPLSDDSLSPRRQRPSCAIM